MYKLKVDDDELSELSRDFGWKEDIPEFIFIVMQGKTNREKQMICEHEALVKRA